MTNIFTSSYFIFRGGMFLQFTKLTDHFPYSLKTIYFLSRWEFNFQRLGKVNASPNLKCDTIQKTRVNYKFT